MAQLDERHAKRTALCWNRMTDTEHSTKSGSNKEDQQQIFVLKLKI